MTIKDKLRAFGILVIRMFWPGKGSKSLQKLGILILGIGAMIGITQAGTIQRFVSASLLGENSDPKTESKQVASTKSLPTVIEQDAANSDVDLDKTFSSIPNVVNLIGESETIFRGVVEEVTDGIENGVPYTEVSLRVSETIRGEVEEKYSFRQFGLIAPKRMDNGKVNLNVTPAGWATYSQGEDVVLFLYEKARLTGLQTTTGLGQGKLELKGGNAESQFKNVGLFENVEVADTRLINDKDRRLLASKKGAVNAESLLSFVRKAVNGKWVEGGKLRHAKK